MATHIVGVTTTPLCGTDEQGAPYIRGVIEDLDTGQPDLCSLCLLRHSLAVAHGLHKNKRYAPRVWKFRNLESGRWMFSQGTKPGLRKVRRWLGVKPSTPVEVVERHLWSVQTMKPKLDYILKTQDTEAA